MSSTTLEAIEKLQAATGGETTPGDWLQIEQSQIDAFADVTLDRQFIHVDPQRCQHESPYKVPIAHGFLSLSLIPHLASSCGDAEIYRDAQTVVNYGLDRVRFPSPVKVSSRVRARRELISAEAKKEHVIQITQRVTVEIEGEDKPACVADCLSHLVLRDA